jgi:putative ABC transport system permease protein
MPGDKAMHTPGRRWWSRLLLRLYPAPFRDEYGTELTRILERRLRDAPGRAARAGVWWSAAVDTAGSAARVHVDLLRQDVRHAWRSLRRSPGFALAALAVTALGVGATTAAFTLTDYVLFRPLPFPGADRLVKIVQGSATRPPNLRGLRGTNDISPALYLAWKASASFSGIGAYGLVSANLSGDGEPERLDGAVVTVSALDTVGVAPALGRALTPADDAAGAACSVLISDGLWRRRFGADPAVLGRRIRIDDEVCDIAGVMPRAFNFPTRTTSFWRPARFTPEAFEDVGNTFLRAIARLKAGTSVDQARVELAGVSANALRAWPTARAQALQARTEFDAVAPVLLEMRDELADQPRLLLAAMAGAAACLLLIACTNLASLTVARATARGRELALRTLLGAGQRRLLRQLLTESLGLALAGGALGVLIAILAIPLAARLVPTALPIAEVPAIDGRLLLIALAVTLGTGIGFGVLPAFRAARGADGGQLRDGARTGVSRSSMRLRDGLVILQVAASIVLIVGTGLLVRALIRVQSTPSGFTSDHVLTARTFLPWSRYGEQAVRVEFYRRVLGEVAALPGVTAAAYTSYLPMTMRGGVWGVTIAGRQPSGRAENASARFITPDYFRAMGIPVVGGRTFDESDAMSSEPVAIVSESFVASYLQGREPLGTRFQFGPAGERAIVGIAGDVRVRGLEARSEPQVYLSYQQQGDNRTMGYTPKDLVVRVRPDRPLQEAMDALMPAIRRIIWDADPAQPISDVQPLAAIVDGETTARAVQVRVLAGFAAVSCVLAGVGLYGLLAFVVSSRTREFGVRLALGAEPRSILALVARRGLVLAGIGVLGGVLTAYTAARWIDALLAGVSPADAWTFAGAIACSLAMALTGSLLPARRAARINPKLAMEVD